MVFTTILYAGIVFKINRSSWGTLQSVEVYQSVASQTGAETGFSLPSIDHLVTLWGYLRYYKFRVSQVTIYAGTLTAATKIYGRYRSSPPGAVGAYTPSVIMSQGDIVSLDFSPLTRTFDPNVIPGDILTFVTSALTLGDTFGVSMLFEVVE